MSKPVLMCVDDEEMILLSLKDQLLQQMEITEQAGSVGIHGGEGVKCQSRAIACPRLETSTMPVVEPAGSVETLFPTGSLHSIIHPSAVFPHSTPPGASLTGLGFSMVS